MRERGLQEEYARALGRVICRELVPVDDEACTPEFECWLFATATAAQRLEAVLVACGLPEGE